MNLHQKWLKKTACIQYYFSILSSGLENPTAETYLLNYHLTRKRRLAAILAVIAAKAQVLLMTLTMALFYSSVPVDRELWI